MPVLENGARCELHPLHPSSESVAELPFSFFLTSVISVTESVAELPSSL
ncbi:MULTISPECIES: hypothetical protein [unclassified Microcoleus]